VVDDVKEHYLRRLEIQRVFRPGAPIEKGQLFSGRSKQMHAILSAIGQPGRHAVLYGERGVGKTSLSNVMREILEESDSNALVSQAINCNSTDDFSSIWHKVFRELSLTMQMKGVGFGGLSPDAQYTLDSMLNAEVRPDDIRFALAQIRPSVVVLLDEFNTLQGKREVTTLMAETIKDLSDHTMNVTVVLIGVADNVDELVAGHQSIGRSLEQILMPRMSNDELREIIDRALPKINMTMESAAKESIVRLSHGLPHFTHLLGRDAAISAFDDKRQGITYTDVYSGIVSAAGNEHSLMKEYTDAVASPQKTNRFPEVLLACARTQTDGLGWFAPADICKPLAELSTRRCDVPSFSRHLTQFCHSARGKVLESKGEARRIRYRFTNPLMQPFVILQGIRSGMWKLDAAGEKPSS